MMTPIVYCGIDEGSWQQSLISELLPGDMCVIASGGKFGRAGTAFAFGATDIKFGVFAWHLIGIVLARPNLVLHQQLSTTLVVHPSHHVVNDMLHAAIRNDYGKIPWQNDVAITVCAEPLTLVGCIR